MKAQEQEKFYHLVYRAFHDNEDYEQIINERDLLSGDYYLCPLRFINRYAHENDYNIDSAGELFCKDMQEAIEAAVDDPNYTFSDYREIVMKTLDEWQSFSPCNCESLSDYYGMKSIRWIDDAGVPHTVVAKEPIELIKGVFDEIRDADKLEINEVSAEEAEKIQKRLDREYEIKRFGYSMNDEDDD